MLDQPAAGQPSEDLDQVTGAYTARLDAYVDAVGSIDDAAKVDQELIATWASTVHGPILDVGSGPGQWTDFLRQRGHLVTGVEPTAAFRTSARERFPEGTYRDGRAEDLGVPDVSVGGILAWYSLIHTDPAKITIAFAEFARALAPEGQLLLGFFTGDTLQPFDHAITTAWFWPVDDLVARVAAAGLVVTAVDTRSDPGHRPHGSLMAHVPRH